MMTRAQAVYYQAPKSVAMAETDVATPKSGEVLIRTRYSAISPGTESLIFRGELPHDPTLNSHIVSRQGRFNYPFKYGCSLVGEVTAVGCDQDRDWLGKQVFTYHPHQSYAVVDKQDCQRLPDDTPMERALFLAAMEAALNIVFDAAPSVGERIMVFGQGILGLLTTAILSDFPLAELITADPISPRRERSLEIGADLSIDPSDRRAFAALKDCLFFGDAEGLDVAIEVSGRTNALDQAIELTGFAGRIIVGSWYGKKSGAVDLGGHFHRRRLQLISSQVNTISPHLQGRWNRNRRLNLAWDWLRRIKPEQLITHRFPLQSCQEALELVHNKSLGVFQVIFQYD
jgi:2-desacetyl-2-hydroxyethyl bacteriochlorophyllide A dehydrogenase